VISMKVPVSILLLLVLLGCSGSGSDPAGGDAVDGATVPETLADAPGDVKPPDALPDTVPDTLPATGNGTLPGTLPQTREQDQEREQEGEHERERERDRDRGECERVSAPQKADAACPFNPVEDAQKTLSRVERQEAYAAFNELIKELLKDSLPAGDCERALKAFRMVGGIDRLKQCQTKPRELTFMRSEFAKIY